MNLVYLLIVLPLLCILVYYGVAALLPRRSPEAVPLLAALCLYVVAAYVHWKDRQRVVWAVGALAGGLVAFREPVSPLSDLVADKRCPDCAELVRRAARVCRFCHYKFAPAEVASPEVSEELATTSAPKTLAAKLTNTEIAQVAGELAARYDPKASADPRSDVETAYPAPKPAWLQATAKEPQPRSPAYSPAELAAMSPLLALDALRDAGWTIDIDGQIFHVRGIRGFQRNFEGLQAVRDWLGRLGSWNDVVSH